MITNPPFRLAEAFILRALPIARRGVAMLSRTVFVKSIGRYGRMFLPHPPAKMAQFTERVPMVQGRLDRRASTATGYAGIIWEKGWHRPTQLLWIPPCRKRLRKMTTTPRMAFGPIRHTGTRETRHEPCQNNLRGRRDDHRACAHDVQQARRAEEVVTLDGVPWAPRPRVDNAMVKALARAFRWRRMLDEGACATLEELARAKGVGASYVSRVLRLTLLAPDIVEAIMDGRQPAELRLDDLLEGFPLEWEGHVNPSGSIAPPPSRATGNRNGWKSAQSRILASVSILRGFKGMEPL